MSLRSLITDLKGNVKKTFSGVDTAGSLSNKFWQSKTANNLAKYQQSKIGQSHIKAGKATSKVLFKNPYEFGQQTAKDISDLVGMNKPNYQMRNAPNTGWKNLKTQVVDRVLPTASFIAGTGNPAGVASMTALGGGINYASNRVFGKQDSKTALSNTIPQTIEMLPKSFQMAGISRFTNPVIEKAGLAGKGFVARNAIKAPLNVGEGKIMDKATGMETTKESMLIDALAPALFDLGGMTFKSANDARIKAKYKIDETLGTGARKNGKYASLDQLLGKGKKGGKAQMAGVMWGVQPYQDEDGKWKVRFNKERALLGLGLAYGGTKVLKGAGDTAKGSDLDDILKAQNLKNNADDLISEARKYKSAEEFMKTTNVGKGINDAGYGFLTKDGTFVSNTGSHLSTLNQSGIEGKGALNDYMNYGGIRVFGGQGGLNIEIHRQPSAEQMSALNKISDTANINYDIYRNGELISGPLDGVSKKEFMSQLTDIYNQANKVKGVEVKGGDLKVKDAGKSYIEMPKNKEEAVTKLKATQDYPNVLRDLGFDKDTINKTSYKKPTKMMDDVLESGGGRQQNIDETTLKGILSEEEIPSFKQKWNSAFNKIKNTPKEIQRLLTDTRTKNLVGRADANQYALKFKDIPEEDGWKMIQFMQNPSPETAKRLNFEPNKYQNEMAEIRKTFDTLRQEAIDKGIDVGYLDNYVNQVWKEDAGEIARRMSISKNPSFAKEKKWPSYEVGMKSIKENGLGLTPKYTHPAQLVAHYKYQMERALANIELVNGLKDSGYILPSKEAPSDWKYLDIMGLGEDLRAPNNIADAVNTMFDKGSGGLMEIPAKISKYMQDITLSGGYKQFNAFTLGQVIKEVTGGRIKSPLKALFMTDIGLKNYAESNAKYIKMASEEGINTRLATDYDKMFDNLTESKSLTKIIGEKWDNFISKPTFQKFMPILQTEFFKDVYEKGIKEGLSPEQARKIAGDSTKNWYGLIDNFTRSKNVDNTLSALVFAPTYRESMVNFWVKNLQSVTPKNISNATFKQNRKFLAGTAVTFVLFELLNKQLTGHWMHENKEGKGVSIEVPVGKERSWFIPILPSVGTVPRRVVEMTDALVKGDTRTMMQKAGSFLSQPVSLGSQLLSNRTFYGGPIYEEEDNALQRFGKLGGYALEQSSHPFIGEPLAVAQGRKTPIEGLLGMAELPIYPSKSSNATHLTSKEAKTYRELNKSDPKKAQKYWDEQKNAYDETKAREKVKSTGEPITVNGKYIYKKDDGELGSVILERDITPPKLTGQPQLDKEKISDYKTKLSNRANDIVKLYELGLLTEEEAEKELTKIIEIKESLKTTKSSGGSKSKKSNLVKISQNTLKTVKVSSKSPKFNTFEILSNYKKTKMPEIKAPNLKVIDFKTAKLKKGTK